MCMFLFFCFVFLVTWQHLDFPGNKRADLTRLKDCLFSGRDGSSKEHLVGTPPQSQNAAIVLVSQSRELFPTRKIEG